MKDVIDKATRAAIRHYGDGAAARFYTELRERRFMSTRCPACDAIAFPPRSFCPKCYGTAVEWVDLPRRGTVYAFTQQERSLRFSRPDVIGLVELPSVGRILTRLDAPFEALRIGLTVELDFFEVNAELVLHQFRPVG